MGTIKSVVKRLSIPLLACSLCACGAGGDDYMPLQTGKTWTYKVQANLNPYVEPIKVNRRISVAGVDGFELTGPLGQSRLAWKDGHLLADRLGSSRFNPPITLLAPSLKRPVDWKGQVSSLAGREDGKASLTQTSEEITLGGRKYSTLRSRLALETPRHTIELLTWFSAGTGIVRQEQRTDGRQNIAFEILSGS